MTLDDFDDFDGGVNVVGADMMLLSGFVVAGRDSNLKFMGPRHRNGYFFFGFFVFFLDIFFGVSFLGVVFFFCYFCPTPQKKWRLRREKKSNSIFFTGSFFTWIFVIFFWIFWLFF